MIEGRHLKKAFHGKSVLEDVSFLIGEGETVGLYGESGIGKSTIAKLLTGVYRPDAGEILLDGIRLVSGDTPYDRKRGIVIQQVFQQPDAALDPKQRVSDGLLELIRYHQLAKNREEEKRLAASAMESVGLEPAILTRLPHQISGGEAQRVCIAKCMLFRPRLLILDEATSMLDVSTQANVIGMVRRKMQEANGSILLISHDRPLVDHLSDRIYIFDKKQIKEKNNK